MPDTKKSKDIPVTQEMLYEVRDELKSDMTSLKLVLGAKIDSLTSEIKDQNAKFHRMLTLYEEQENKNNYVLDGYSSLNDRIEKIEKSLQAAD